MEHSKLTGTYLRKYKIAVAHNANDRAETYIFNLTRGAGLKGLSGIKPVNGDIIRPILCLSRDEIENICHENNISFVTDSTNNEDIYTRNFIRHKIIEPLANINEMAVAHINEAADRAKEAYDYIDGQAKEIFEKCSVVEHDNIGAVKSVVRVMLNFDLKHQPAVIRKSVYSKAVECLAGNAADIYSTRFDAIDELLLNGTTGKTFSLEEVLLQGLIIKCSALNMKRDLRTLLKMTIAYIF